MLEMQEYIYESEQIPHVESEQIQYKECGQMQALTTDGGSIRRLQVYILVIQM